MVDGEFMDEEEKRVFISYSSINTDIAKAACNHLEDNGISCWMAPRDIKTGSNYAEEIINGLLNADIVLLMFSKDAQASEYVNNEIDTAFSKNKPIIAFNIDGSLPEKKMAFFLKNTQWLFASPNPDEHLDQLVTDTSRILKDLEDGVYVPPPPYFGDDDDDEEYEGQERGFLEKHKYKLLAVVIILVVATGFLLFSNSGGDSEIDSNVTRIVIDYVGVAEDGESYYVYGNVTVGLNNTSDYKVQTDFYDDSGNVIETNKTSLNDIDANTICQSVLDKDASKVSVKLMDENGKTVTSAESDNIIK